jgi:hypothetical protein
VQGRAVTRGYVGQTPVLLLLDTGAMTNTLDLAFTQQLAPARRPRLLGKGEPYVGLGGTQQAQRAILHELRLPPTAWRELPVAIAKLAQPTNGAAAPY